MSKDDSNVSVDGQIDAGWSSYFDPDKHGQTISGTSDDDLGEVVTNLLPANIDPSDLTEKQRLILETYHQYPDSSHRLIAEKTGCARSHVSDTIRTYTDGDVDNEDDEKSEDERETKGKRFEDLNENQKTAIDEYLTNPGENAHSVSSRLGFSKGYLDVLKSRHPGAFTQRKEELSNDESISSGWETTFDKSGSSTDGSDVPELDYDELSIGGGDDEVGQIPSPDPEQGPEQLSKEAVQEVKYTVVHEHHHTVEHNSDNLSETVGAVAGIALVANVAETVFEALGK